MGRVSDGIEFDTQALHQDLDVKRQRLGLSWRELGLEAGVTASTFTRLAQDAGIDINHLLRLLMWLGDLNVGAYVKGINYV